jgi:hypothetical protein
MDGLGTLLPIQVCNKKDSRYEWHSVLENDSMTFRRIKNQEVQRYSLDFLARGHNGIIYSIIPDPTSQKKKVKVLKYPLPTVLLDNEHDILMYLHKSNSNPVGIVKPPKAFITLKINEKMFGVMILSKYGDDGLSWRSPC